MAKSTAYSSVQSFLSHFDAFARPNRFLVNFNMPSGVGGNEGDWTNSESKAGAITGWGNKLNTRGAVNVACHACTMPGRRLMTYTHSQHCAPYEVPYSQQYEPVTFSFYNNSTMDQRHFFEIWQTAVVNINDNSMNFMIEYSADVFIYQLDRQNVVTYGVQLYNAYPVAINEVSYDYGSNNTVQSSTVTLAYKLWRSLNDKTHIVVS